jgi:hypothetical protein
MSWSGFRLFRFLDHVLGEIVDDLEVDVGFEKCGAHLAHRFADVFFGDLPPPREVAENGAELVG